MIEAELSNWNSFIQCEFTNFNNKLNSLILIKLGFLRVAFSGGAQFDPSFLFQQELI